MTEILRTDDAPVPHPLADGQGERWVATETRAEVVPLTAALSDFLSRAAEARLRPLLITGPFSRLTLATAEALGAVLGVWVIRASDGSLYDGRSGKSFTSIAEAAEHHPLTGPADIAPAFLRTPIVAEMTLRFTVSTRHRVSRPLVLGGPAQSLSERLTGRQPAAWGGTEPLIAAWNRADVTEYSRRRMPHQSRWAFRTTPDAPLSGSIVVARTSEGVEETTHVWAPRGLPDDQRITTLADDAFDGLLAVREHGMPLMGVVVAQPGAADATVRSGPSVPPVPLALLVGAPGIRQLRVPVADWLAGFDAVTVGSPRLPAVLFRLGGADDDGWSTVGEILSTIDADVLETALIPSEVTRDMLRRTSDA